MSEKIGSYHLERKAILYVRQSSAHEVLHNRKSSTLQYAMRARSVTIQGNMRNLRLSQGSWQTTPGDLGSHTNGRGQLASMLMSEWPNLALTAIQAEPLVAAESVIG